jgi:hypothetical protein
MAPPSTLVYPTTIGVPVAFFGAPDVVVPAPLLLVVVDEPDAPVVLDPDVLDPVVLEPALVVVVAAVVVVVLVELLLPQAAAAPAITTSAANAAHLVRPCKPSSLHCRRPIRRYPTTS